ncbi:MAG: PaeR7I family type II restriction endonuclease [bacterium]
MKQKSVLDNLPKALSDAVTKYWLTRKYQFEEQKRKGSADQGARGAVTGGAQMDGFITLFTKLLMDAGVDQQCIFHQTALQLPGFFRPTKEWDILVVRNGELLVTIETKSQVGPSFGNNFNNRTEEAMGSALDLWTAFREGAFNKSAQPFLGYFFMLEDCAASQRPVRVHEPHFKVFPEFKDASYTKRYELFCRKLVRERHYTAVAFITSQRATGLKGIYSEPARDLSPKLFIHSLFAHVSAHLT